MYEVKAHMIVPEGQAKVALESFFDPFAAALLKLAALVQKHPVIALLALFALCLLVFRFAYRAR
jgi:hypothetical protein